MATIKEMAEDYAKEQDLRESYNGSCDTPKSAYIKGANAVLEEVESIIDYAKNKYPRFHQGTIIQARIENLIKELKGE